LDIVEGVVEWEIGSGKWEEALDLCPVYCNAHTYILFADLTHTQRGRENHTYTHTRIHTHKYKIELQAKSAKNHTSMGLKETA